MCMLANLSAVITVGSCAMVSELSFLARSLQLPYIGLPTELCYPHKVDFGVIGSHGTDDMIDAAVAAMGSKSTDLVAVFYDTAHAAPILQRMQNGLSTIGISSITFNVHSIISESDLIQVSLKMKQLIKKQVFNAIVIATPSNALNILRAAVNASVMQQNYFWLIIDTGISKSQLMSVCPINCNLALLRGGTTGINEAGRCSRAVREIFEECDRDNIRTLDIRVVDAIAAVAKALTTSMLQGSFEPSNATCFPLQSWSSGADVIRNIISISGYDTDGGIISYNSTTGFFNAQGLEFVASFTERLESPVKFVVSAHFSNNTLTKIFRKRNGASFVFPNIFTGFNNATLVICAVQHKAGIIVLETFPNKTSIVRGMHFEIIEYLAANMEFRFIIKLPEDGKYGGPQAGVPYFSGCVGEVQRGLVHFAAGPFTKTTDRDSVIDFAAGLHQEVNVMMLPRPKLKSNMWNMFMPLGWNVWLVLVASLFVTTSVVWFLGKFSPFSAINLNLKSAINDEASYLEYLWTIIGSFMFQGQEFYPNATSPRMALAFWWIFTIIIYSSYTAFLASALTVTATEFSIRTLDEFLMQTKITPVVIPGTNIATLITRAESGVYRKLADRLVQSRICHELPLVGDFACISDRLPLYYMSQLNCSKVYLADETFNTATVAYMYPDDAYYGRLFDFYIAKLTESGAMQRLITKHYTSPVDDAACQPIAALTGAEAIGLDTAAGCLIVTAGFFGIGLLFLGCELLTGWLRHRRRT